jgi:hypothetical protein
MNNTARMGRFCDAIRAFTKASDQLAEHRKAGTAPTAAESVAVADARVVMVAARRVYLDAPPPQGMTDARRFNELRARYRALWDAYQVIAHENVKLLRDGKKPTDKQLMDEQRAVATVGEARDELVAAINRVGD